MTLKTYLTAFLILTITFIACSKKETIDNTNSGGNPPPVNILVTNITISPASAALAINTSQQFTATLLPANATDKSVVWLSSNPGVASVNPTGIVSALSAGTTIITAKSVSSPTVSVTATVTVLRGYQIYIGGNGTAPSLGIATLDYYACFWKNGALTRVNGGADVGRSVRALNVDANDNVYTAGIVINGYGWYKPTLWINSNYIPLTDNSGDYSEYANGLAVSGSNTYVAGYKYFSFATNSWFASLYKITGNVITPMVLPIPAGMNQSDAYGVAVMGNDVYTAGSVLTNFVSSACYWKNSDQPIVLAGTTDYLKAKAICASGNNIYIAGYEGCGSLTCVMTVKLWRNNSSAGFTVASGTAAMPNVEVTGISISGTDIYISGTIAGGGKSMAMVWKVNGTTVTTIPLTDGSKNAIANSVTTINNEAFVVGNEDIMVNQTLVHRPRYWRLYEAAVVEVIDIIDPQYTLPTNECRAYGIFVK